jgi:PAS domain S-box-containing protein
MTKPHMKAILPEIEEPLSFRGIEFRPGENEEVWRGKLADITLDERFQLVAVWNSAGVLLACRSSVLNSEVVGLPFWEAFSCLASRETLVELRSEAESVAAQGEYRRRDWEFHGPSLIDLTLTPVKDTRNRVVLMVLEGRIASRDLKTNEWAEQALARLTAHTEQERRLYHTILSSTPDLVYVFDLNHRFTYANEALLTMWGKSAAEAIGKNCLELGYEPWHAEMHDREIEQVIATKQPVRGDVPFTGTHGRRVYDYIFVPVLDANGNVEAIAGTTRDVTERKLAEQKSQESEERLRFMAESMPQKIFTARADGEMDYFNRQWMDFAGLTLEEIQGWKWTDLIHPDDAAESLRVWKQATNTGEPFQFTHRFRRRDGVYRWHLSRIHAMPSGDGRVMMWIGSSTEIHEQKAIEEELRRANQDLEQFAYAASHDLQEPLRGIKIYSELLAKNYGSSLDQEGVQFLQHLKNGASRMEMLVRGLLAYTQVVEVENPTSPVNADASLRVALDNLSGAIQEADARITSDPLPTLNIQPTHLQQLFQNLLGNAIKYRRPETIPVIHVTARPVASSWVFTVSDNGIGIEST